MSNYSILLFGDIFILHKEFRKYYSHMIWNFIVYMCKDSGSKDHVFVRSLSGFFVTALLILILLGPILYTIVALIFFLLCMSMYFVTGSKNEFDGSDNVCLSLLCIAGRRNYFNSNFESCH